MNALRKQLFSGSGLAVNHHRGVGFRRLPALLYHVFHHRADMHDIIKMVARRQCTFSAVMFARVALRDELCLEFYNFFVERIHCTPVFHDAVSAQHLTILHDWICIGRNVHIFVITRGINLPPPQINLLFSNGLRNNQALTVQRFIHFFVLFSDDIARHDLIHLNTGVVQKIDARLLIAHDHRVTDLLQRMLEHIALCVARRRPKDNQPAVCRQILRRRRRTPQQIFIEAHIRIDFLLRLQT